MVKSLGVIETMYRTEEQVKCQKRELCTNSNTLRIPKSNLNKQCVIISVELKFFIIHENTSTSRKWRSLQEIKGQNISLLLNTIIKYAVVSTSEKR
jgi:hypothetical protein